MTLLWLRRGAVGLGGLVLAVALYLLATLAGAVLPNGAPVPPEGTDVYRVGIVLGPIHADLLIPLSPDVRADFAFAEAAGVPVTDPRAEWLVVGWGAQEFYTTVGRYSDVTARAVWRGVTGDASVMRVEVAGRITDFTGIDLLALTPAQFDRLRAAILDSFARGPDGNPVPLAHPGFSGTDEFFKAKDRFHIFRTCNVWLSDLLALAGVPFGRWTPTPQAVRLAFWRFGP